MTTDTAKVAAGTAGGVTEGRVIRLFGGLALAAALSLVPAGRAQAQWSTGFGGYGGYGSNIGITNYDQDNLKMEISGLNRSQYELNVSQAYRAQVEAQYMQAQMILAQQQARLTYLHSVETSLACQERISASRRDAGARRVAPAVVRAQAGEGGETDRPAPRAPRTRRGRRVAPRVAQAPAMAERKSKEPELRPAVEVEDIEARELSEDES